MTDQETISVNPDLVWDYEIPDDSAQDEAFRQWYVARVLTRGRMEDIQNLGLDTIYAYLPRLILPERIRRFWQWYFDHADVKARYGLVDSPAA